MIPRPRGLRPAAPARPDAGAKPRGGCGVQDEPGDGPRLVGREPPRVPATTGRDAWEVFVTSAPAG